MGTASIVVPIDAVTLHRWDSSADRERWWGADGRGPATDGLGEQIGDPILVTGSEPRTITFPTHRGEPSEVYVVTWNDGQVMTYHGPHHLFDGEAVTLQVPIVATLS